MGQQTYEVMTQQQSFGEFIWNSRTNEFLGRNGMSWAKITIFYILYYFFLAGFMSAALYIFMQTIDYDLPSYNPGDGGSILKNQALAIRPLPRPDRIESSLIWFDVKDPSSYNHSVKSINDYVKPYHDEKIKKSFKYVACSDTVKPDHDKGQVCDYDLADLEPGCSAANGWGFKAGQPCILLKMNKMIFWEPEMYLNDTDLEHKSVKDQQHVIDLVKANPTGATEGDLYKKMIWLTCEGENEPDQEYLGEVKYYPQQGFPAYYYPYKNTKGYLPPVVAVHFTNIKRNVLINVECKVWAKNIKHVRKTRLGISHFELLIDDKPQKKL